MDSENITSEKIHVVFTPYDMADSYNRHVGAAITSLLENCSVPAVIHIMYDENLNRDTKEYEINKNNYLSFTEKYDVEILLHHVKIPEWYDSLKGSKILSVGTYYRLFIPETLSDIEKVIYLDGDVIVRMDLKDFWSVDIEGYPLAARVDPMFREELERKPKGLISTYKKFGFSRKDLERYFNAGILYLNLKQIRKEYNLSEDSGKYLKDSPKTPRADQDALNYLFSDNYLQLPEKNNLFAYEVGTEIPNACIHYVTRKPWKSQKDKVDLEYWKYLSMSPWCPDTESLIKYMSEVGNSSEKSLMNTMSQIPLVNLTEIIINHYIGRIKRHLLFIGVIN